MSNAAIANKQLAVLLGVLSHPLRIQIVEELHKTECDVSTLRNSLNVPHSGVSQHLAVLRTHRLVIERREGRRVVYRLADSALADWLLSAFRFLETTAGRYDEIRDAIQHIRDA
jgi:DNA-binding transcriptional ArsR family regulator